MTDLHQAILLGVALLACGVALGVLDGHRLFCSICDRPRRGGGRR